MNTRKKLLTLLLAAVVVIGAIVAPVLRPFEQRAEAMAGDDRVAAPAKAYKCAGCADRQHCTATIKSWLQLRDVWLDRKTQLVEQR